MPRPVTLFTGQWADLPLAELAPLARKMGFDGLELACWGDHFDVDRAASDPAYCKARWELRWIPILDAYDELDVNFALEVHPTEIAFDIASAARALDPVNGQGL